MTENTITLGSELRRLRTRKGISQFDLAVAMDWKGTNPIIQIEKSRRIPKPDTIERLGACLGLSYPDIHYLHGLAGYVLPTRFPPQDYIINILEQINTRLESFPYPAIVLDYQYRMWLCNPATALLGGGSMDAVRDMVAGGRSALEMSFDSRMGLRDQMSDLGETDKEFLFVFKATNLFRRHEPFYQALPERLAETLLPDDYRVFARAWQQIDPDTVAGSAALPVAEFYVRLDEGDLTLTFPEGAVDCHLRREPIFHLSDLFYILTIHPVDTAAHPENKQLADDLLSRYTPQGEPSAKLWELVDWDAIS